jgi:hypothetical protein
MTLKAALFSGLKAAFVSCGAALLALASSSPLAHDLPPVSPSQQLLLRKDSREAPEEGPWPLLGNLVNTHTDEVVPLGLDEPTPDRWSALLQDRVFREATPMAPPLLAMLRALSARHPHARIELVSGFRSPKLNEMMRKKGHRVASHSQHSLGQAVDFRLVGLTPKEMRREVRGLGWEGGIGQYDKPTDRFIHIDVGRRRDWHER